MSNFRQQFEAKLPAIESALSDMSDGLDEALPGLTRKDLSRFFRRLGPKLTRLDKTAVRNPEFLVLSDGYAPSLLMSVLDEVPSELDAGPSSFATSSFPRLVTISEALDRAVGTDPQQLKAISTNVATDLGNLVARNEDLAAAAQASVKKVESVTAEAETLRGQIAELTKRLATENQTASKLRTDLEQALNPDARFKSTLESLARRARERVGEIDETKGTTDGALSAIQGNLEGSQKALAEANEHISSLRVLKEEAESVLQLSSQAGLAASYIREAKRLGWRALAFTAVLYLATGVTVWFAIEEVLPGMGDAIDKIGPQFSATEALSMSILRLLLILPLAYVIYFTSSRVHDLELLRMDYSEKAAASLAYSGYSEQMNSDAMLLAQLKASLLAKFNEHPERLLGKGTTRTSATIKVPGYVAATEFLRSGSKDSADVEPGATDRPDKD